MIIYYKNLNLDFSEVESRLKTILKYVPPEASFGVLYLDESSGNMYRSMIPDIKNIFKVCEAIHESYTTYIISISGYSPPQNKHREVYFMTSEPEKVDDFGYVFYRGDLNLCCQSLDSKKYSEIIAELFSDFIVENDLKNSPKLHILSQFLRSDEYKNLSINDDDVLMFVPSGSVFEVICNNPENMFTDSVGIEYSSNPFEFEFNEEIEECDNDVINLDELEITEGATRLINLIESNMNVTLNDITSDITTLELKLLIQDYPSIFADLLMDGESKQYNEHKPMFEIKACSECEVWSPIEELIPVENGKDIYICEKCKEEILSGVNEISKIYAV